MKRLELIRNQINFNKTRDIMDDIFSHVKMGPADPIAGTMVKFREDKFENKMNLGVGVYRSEEGQPVVFEIVKQVEQELTDDLKTNKLNKE